MLNSVHFLDTGDALPEVDGETESPPALTSSDKAIFIAGHLRSDWLDSRESSVHLGRVDRSRYADALVVCLLGSRIRSRDLMIKKTNMCFSCDKVIAWLQINS